MSIKIIHAADFHIDSPFEALPAEKAALRRREQRELIEKIGSLAKKEAADLILLSGDLLDSDVSYYETGETLEAAFSEIDAKIFISPGNHDYFCRKSPYFYTKFPENVYIFKSSSISCFDIPELNCRVWGAGFTTPLSEPLLSGFSCDNTNMINLMVMHGDLIGDAYNHISEQDIEGSGLDYIALGHIHTFSGILKAGKTAYAYPGCPEGRGFDETGSKGVITGTVGKNGCDLRFVPLGGREYNTLTIDMTGRDDPCAKLGESIPENAHRDIYRVIFTGEYCENIDLSLISESYGDRFFHADFRDHTVRPGDIWQGVEENSLRGVFLGLMKKAFENASCEEKQRIENAVRYALAAIDRREAWRP